MQNTSPKRKNRVFRAKGFFIPFGLCAFFSVFVYFFADRFLKAEIENYASLVNGAQVNIGSLRTRLFAGTVDLERIQVTHHTHPSRNLVEISELQIKFLWLPLLAGKFVSPEIRVRGIQLLTARDNFGALNISPDSPALPPGLLDRAAPGVYEVLRKDLGDTPLRKLGMLSAGLGTQMRVDQLRNQLSSMKKMADLEKEVEFRTGTWEKASSIFHESDWVEGARRTIAEAESQIKSSRKTASLRPNLDAVRKQILSEKTKLEDAIEEIQQQGTTLRKALYSIDDTLGVDVTNIRDSFGLPRLDGGDFTHALLGPKLLNFLERAAYWVDVSRRRMPTTGHDYGGIIVMERPADHGSDVVFGKKSTYPLVLIMKVILESETIPGNKTFGSVNGEIRNFTTDPPIWRQPTEMKVRADFPGLGIRNVKLSALVNHTRSLPVEEFRLSMESFPLTDWVLENTSDLKLIVKKAEAKLNFDGSFKGDELLTQWSVLASQVEYSIETRFRLMQDALKDAFVPFSSLYASGTVKGSSKDLKLDLASNVGKRLGMVLKDRFKHSLEAVDDIVRQSILDQVELPRRRLREKLAEVQSRIEGQYRQYMRVLAEMEQNVKGLEPKTRPSRRAAQKS